MKIERPFFVFGGKGFFCAVGEYADGLTRGKEPEKVRIALV
jgi:hypothetical protein